MALKRGRGDILTPAPPVPGKAIVSYPTPNIVDVVVREDVQVSPHQYKPLPYGTPHPLNEQTGIDLRLVYQGPPTGNDARKTVQRIYASERTAQNVYNYAQKFSEESTAHPIFIRSYIELRQNYSPLPKNSKFSGIMTAKVTNGGEDYDPDHPPTVVVSGGGGTGAVLRAVVYNGVVAYLQILNEGSGYTSTPTIGFTDEQGGSGAAATAAIQPSSAVLVNEEMQRIDNEDPKLASLFVRVHRVYKVIPGPPLVTKSIGQADLTPQKYRRLVRTVETNQVVSPDYSFPNGLIGNQTQIEHQQQTIAEARLKIIEEIIAISADPLIGGQSDEWGALAIYETVVNEGTPIDEGFLILKSSVTPFGNGKAVKITVKYPSDLAARQLRGQNYDDTLDIAIPFRERLVGPGNEIGDNRKEITPIDQFHSRVKELDLAGVAVLQNYLLAFPNTTVIRMPDILTDIQIFSESTLGVGYSSEGVVCNVIDTPGSFTIPSRASSEASAVFTKEVVPIIIPLEGTIRDTTSYLFFLPVPVTRAAVISKLQALTGASVVSWPQFHPNNVTIVVASRSVDLAASASATSHFTISSGVNYNSMVVTGVSSSKKVGVTVRTIRLPPTIHGDLRSLIGTGGSTGLVLGAGFTAEAHVAYAGYGACFPGSVDSVVSGNAGCTVAGYNLNATPGDTELPATGLLIVGVDAAPYKWGYARIRAETVDVSTL